VFTYLLSIVFCFFSGLSSSHFAWAFHSVAEEELLNMLPAMQKNDPTWSELRAMGVGWWVRNALLLRRCIEKVSVLIHGCTKSTWRIWVFAYAAFHVFSDVTYSILFCF
jgi:hypothetical protein